MSAEPSTAAQTHPVRPVAAFLKTALVFALVGPPIGWLIFAFGLFVLIHGNDVTLTDVAKSDVLFIVGLPLSYIIGGVPALIAGLLAGTARARPRQVPIGYSAAFGVAAGLAFAFSFDRNESSAQMIPVWQYDGLKILTCLVPVMLCWRLTRRFQMRPTA